MVGIYDIFLGKEIIGQANVTRQGLYYHFACKCDLSGDVLYRVSVSCHGHHENLGILIPAGSGFGLSTKVSVRRLGEGRLQFRALPKHQKCERVFVPVYPDEPFSYITRLQNAFLEVRDGQAGVLLGD